MNTYCCDNFKWAWKQGLIKRAFDGTLYMAVDNNDGDGTIAYITVYHCPYCGADLRGLDKEFERRQR